MEVKDILDNEIKKPKFWDYNKPNLISYFLNPFAKILELKLKFSKNLKIDLIL